MHAFKGIRTEHRIRRQGRDCVATRLDRLAPLDEDTRRLVDALEGAPPLRPRGDFPGERPGHLQPRFIATGWGARVRTLPDGRRQILAFLLPGDEVGLGPRPGPIASGATVAITGITLLDAGPVQAAILSGGPQWRPLREALHVSACLQEACLLNQVTRLGRMTAYERTCHLVLELGERLGMAGIGEPDRFPLPLTQEALADALGLSVVHVNRVLQQLRREGLIDLRAGIVSLRDRGAMRAICDYTSLKPEAWRQVRPAS